MSVQKLAAVECGECKGVGKRKVVGATLQRPPWYEPEPQVDIRQCPTCQGTGKRWHQLWQGCQQFRLSRSIDAFGLHQVDRDHQDCCQGTGYVLRPEAEVTVALIGIAQVMRSRCCTELTNGVYIVKNGDGVYVELVHRSHGWVYGNAKTLNDALAEAIYQAEEVVWKMR